MKVHLLDSPEPLLSFKNVEVACSVVIPDAVPVGMSSEDDIRICIPRWRLCPDCRRILPDGTFGAQPTETRKLRWAYYNEHDAFAAAWLRELIKAGLISDGEVDERDIQQVEPGDLRGFTQCHFFAGIGVWSYALRNAGWPDDLAVWTGSCPCQGFSASGKRGGFSDQRHLWPAWFRLIAECRPDTVFGEQVASKDGLAWFDVVSADLEGAGYAVGAADTCAAGFGAPHIRSRLYFVADTERRGATTIRGAGRSQWRSERWKAVVRTR
jgi:site-specific DNA-cytosine methylase